jgi:hypothetical protein
MKVWVVELILPYEGDINQAVFGDEASAREYARVAHQNDPYRCEYAVTEWEVS